MELIISAKLLFSKLLIRWSIIDSYIEVNATTLCEIMLGRMRKSEVTTRTRKLLWQPMKMRRVC